VIGKIRKLGLILIILLAFVLRLYRINNPLADWHSWRQADTSAVSRNFVKNGFDLLHPRFDDLSNVASGLNNLNGYRFVEFPFYNFFQAGFYKVFPFFSLEVWGRLISIIFSLGSLIFLYLITKKYLGFGLALLAAFFFAVLPFNIFYSRVVLPEPMLVMTSLAMIYFFDRAISRRLRFTDFNLWLAVFFMAVSLLIKPYVLVFILPFSYLGWRQWHFNWWKWAISIFLVLVSIAPFVWWRHWMKNFPEGIPAYRWLFNEANIRFKAAFFWWLFAERLGKLILGFWGLILFGVGLVVRKTKKEGMFFYSWLLAILAYLVIIAAGNVRHDYYQIIAIPIVCVFLAKGAYFLINAPGKFFSRFACYLLLAVCVIFMLFFSWYQVRDFFNINNPAIVEAGKAADKLLPADAKVIAPYGGDTAFLYQTNRQGWPVGISIQKMINLGAAYYVNVNFGPETQWLMGNYCILQKTKKWVIIDLRRKCPRQ